MTKNEYLIEGLGPRDLDTLVLLVRFVLLKLEDLGDPAVRRLLDLRQFGGRKACEELAAKLERTRSGSPSRSKRTPRPHDPVEHMPADLKTLPPEVLDCLRFWEQQFGRGQGGGSVG